MKSIQSGEIELDQMNGRWNWTRTLKAERTEGSSRVLLTFPAGPKTKRIVTAYVSDEEFIRLAQWMRGERR